MKYCSRCKETKAVALFYRDGSRRDGLNNRCMDCCAQIRELLRSQPKPVVDHSVVYVPDPLNLALRDFSYVTNRGQLRPSIGFINRRAA